VLDCFGLVRQDVDVLGLEYTRDVFAVCVFIVISHDSPEVVRRGHLPQEASTGVGRKRRFFAASEQGHRNEVPRQHNQIRMKAVDHGDGGMQRMHRKYGS